MRWKRTMLAALIAAGLLAACQKAPEPAVGVTPSIVEPIEGSEVSRVTLTDRAVERLGVKTVPVRTSQDAGGSLVVPYASLIYDKSGGTWVYTNPEPPVFVRAPVTVASIEGERALLADGPPAGTPVVVVGAAELFGTESGVGH